MGRVLVLYVLRGQLHTAEYHADSTSHRHQILRALFPQLEINFQVRTAIADLARTLLSAKPLLVSASVMEREQSVVGMQW